MYRTRREKRYLALKDAGFVGFEARALSKVSPKVPYMKPMIAERRREYDKTIKWAKKRGMSETTFNKQWLTHIKRKYIMKGWKRKGDIWGQTVAFRMLKTKEEEYRARNEDYESPWQKRQKRWRDFLGNVETKADKYPRGRAYKPKGKG